MKKALVILTMLVFAVALYGCDSGGGNPAASGDSDRSCSSYAGGDERGSWRWKKDPNVIEEFIDGYYRLIAGGGLLTNGPYQKDGSRIIVSDKQTGSAIWFCFEVFEVKDAGSVLCRGTKPESKTCADKI